MNEKWIWLNGRFCFEKEALIPITDHGFLFGEGFFTTIRIHNGKCEFFHRHLQRLHYQSEALGLKWNALSIDLINELIERNRAYQGVWRLKIIVTVIEKEEKRQIGNVLAMMQPIQNLSFVSCTLCLFPQAIESPLAHIKSLSYLDHLYVREYAKKRGFTDAITQMGNGVLLETGCSNLFWIDQKGCWIPDFQLPYLKGIFLQSILPHLTIPIHYIKATRNQVPSDVSIYICNALTHIRPVLSIDDASFPRNPQREELLQQATAQALQGNE